MTYNVCHMLLPPSRFYMIFNVLVFNPMDLLFLITPFGNM